MNNIIDFPVDDFHYITGSDCEPAIVGVKCKDISIQLAPDLHDVLLGDVWIKREELIAFVLAVGICDDFVKEFKES